eukprot:scaffold215763_cov39-Prasinocladus_malaysianus.AAC.1
MTNAACTFRISGKIHAHATQQQKPQASPSTSKPGLKSTLGSFLKSMEASLSQVAGLKFADEGPAEERASAVQEGNGVGADNF